jgi:NAD(P)-dependent dehydrogenase (short-subunit alcohol dehydrogenase family)
VEIALGQHAFITGGASGIGFGIAQAFSDLGLSVTLADIDSEALKRVEGTLPAEHQCVHLDVRDEAGWANARTAAEGRFGPVDILINNAGINYDGEPLTEVSSSSFMQVISINLLGVQNGVRCFGPSMQARGYGYIVNTASVMGLLQGVSGMGVYSASKAAVVALSEALRSELAPFGVGVSVLCPGFVKSNLTENTKKLGGRCANNDRTAAAQSTQMPAREAGDLVVHGIRHELPYLLTHAHYLNYIDARTTAIAASVSKQGLT